MTQDQPQVVDCHVHAVPEALLAEVADRPDPDGVEVRRTPEGYAVTMPGAPERLVRPRMSGAAVRDKTLAAMGIDGHVLAPWLDVQPTAAMPSTRARSWARRLNEALLASRQEVGSVVGCWASVAVDDPATAADDLARAVEVGMRGLVLSTDPVHCESLADPRLEPVWSAAEALRVPVMLHPSADGPSRVLPGSAPFANVYCRLVDTSFAVAKLLLAGVLDRHPALRLVTVHGGGMVPFQSGRLDGGHRADALSSYTIEREKPSDYLADLYYDTVAMSPAAIRFLVDAVGADHVLLGTDFPFALGDPDPVGAVNSAHLEADAAARILGRNVLDLLERA
ncbi:amidohydrolase family protein [Rhizomonospora bruguierae]|uniref:amidohydrolase family protein n=1 Tax=Rhizomonospora bruguierae TaxID=1581705 RepID=UPI001BD17D50|nr:amidohydrolase family protein [Micromonospora sp. NBRC 107566]